MVFKGFDIETAEEWHSIISKLGLKEYAYVGGVAVRRIIVGSRQEGAP